MALFVGFGTGAFVMASVAAALLDIPGRAGTGIWLLAGAGLFVMFGLWAGIDSSMNVVEKNKIRFAREAREEIERARAEEANQEVQD